MSKVKHYQSNVPERQQQPQQVIAKPYVPQYKQLGIEPTVIGKPQVVQNRQPQPVPDNPRAYRNPQLANNQPYAQQVPTGSVGRKPFPNIGNNAEQTWSGVDSDIIGDLSGIDPNEPMIDNNEYVSAESLGFSNDEVYVKANSGTMAPQHPPQNNFAPNNASVVPSLQSEAPPPSQQDQLNEQCLSSILQQLDEGDYLLLVNGDCVCSGPLEDVQEQARLLVFGEHVSCNGEPVPISSIVVLKKVAIKVGLFLS